MKIPKGVEKRSNSIRINFMYKGERYRETLDLSITQNNLNYAGNKVALIKHEIDNGTFDYTAHFPESPHAQKQQLQHYLESWLKIKKTTCAHSTWYAYQSKANKHITPKYGKRNPSTITYTEIEEWIATDLYYLANKTIKEIMLIMHGTMSRYIADNPTIPNPIDSIKITLPDKETPDVFTRHEIEKICTTGTERLQERNLIEFMIWCGPRISEVLALAWEDVDLEKGTITFKRANVRGKCCKVTKTKRSTRKVELLPTTIELLRKQERYTANLNPIHIEVIQRDNKTVRPEKVRFVFYNSGTGKPHASDFTIRQRFFRAHLKKAGVRYRPVNQCRHTYASQMLTIGMPLAWLAKQLGHTSLKMIQEHYAEWIIEDAPQNMAQLAADRLNQNSSE